MTYLIGMLKYIRVCESNDRVTAGQWDSLAVCILLCYRLFKMDFAINLDDQLYLGTIEVSDMATKHNLPLYLESVQTLIANS